MSEEKQIEEMARELCPLAVDKECKDCVFEKRSITCNPKTYAKRSINAGYRKQREGRWKGAGMGDYYCSLCNTTYSGGDEYNYCPNCGAKMKGEE